MRLCIRDEAGIIHRHTFAEFEPGDLPPRRIVKMTTQSQSNVHALAEMLRKHRPGWLAEMTSGILDPMNGLYTMPAPTKPAEPGRDVPQELARITAAMSQQPDEYGQCLAELQAGAKLYHSLPPFVNREQFQLSTRGAIARETGQKLIADKVVELAQQSGDGLHRVYRLAKPGKPASVQEIPSGGVTEMVKLARFDGQPGPAFHVVLRPAREQGPIIIDRRKQK